MTSSAWMRRLGLPVTILVVALVVPASSSVAHPIESFRACARVTLGPDLGCRKRIEVGRGVPVLIRAKARPPHASSVARVLRLRPHDDRWRLVGWAPVGDDGVVRWQWTPEAHHVRNSTPWRFRFGIRDHGWSQAVKVRVRSDDF